jgi:hypothetical protein
VIVMIVLEEVLTPILSSANIATPTCDARHPSLWR